MGYLESYGDAACWNQSLDEIQSAKYCLWSKSLLQSDCPASQNKAQDQVSRRDTKRVFFNLPVCHLNLFSLPEETKTEETEP